MVDGRVVKSDHVGERAKRARERSVTVTTVSEVVQWVGEIDDETVDEVLAALQRRHEALHEARAERAVIGAHVVIHDVTAEYLIGLDGVIEEVDPEEGDVSIRLSAVSTGRLRFSGQKDYTLGADLNYLIHAVPASCCYPADALAHTA